MSLSSIETIIDEARNGRMFILVDDEDRENEGDLVIPAQMATPDSINFMITHGRGLVCLALTAQRVQQLGLPLMAQHNTSRLETAFTVSIEAREGITTGISAADRARTISVAIDPASTATDLASPGHVFPLRAKDGGVLVRAGHTEAAVDVARLAGLNPSGVICEIMNDDGSMARLSDLITFGEKHGIKIATIADLIAYRRRAEKLIERVDTRPFTSRFAGDFTLHSYAPTIGQVEHLVLVKGSIPKGAPTLVRMHAFNIFHDALGDTASGKAGELQAAMQQIHAAGSGVIVLLREAQPGRSQTQEAGSASLRDYGIGAQILLDLGITDMILLSNSKRSVVGLEGYGLTIHGYQPIDATNEV
jgi:3,4-dihydroxy 2-butanone 4-phosphate synthase/GTP cyclohydrolase II